ncbi:MAG: DUF3127 domain-containing protein [Bacteroidota bacterium]
MSLQVKGKLKLKSNEQVVSDRFRKREFVLTDDSTQYPQHISFQLTQDKCSLIDAVNPGDEITVSFNLRGREWKSPQGEIKYFNSLEAWKIDKGAAASTQERHYEEIPEQTFKQTEATDDLPF